MPITKVKGAVWESGDNNLFVSVKDYGAKGDGVTDDASAIQAAIDYVNSISTGGSVYLPSGVYVVGTPITIKSNVRMFGDGDKTSIKGVFSVATNRILTSSSSVLQENIILEKFLIDRRGSNAQHGALFGGVKNFIFRDISIIGPTNPTIACGAVGFSPFSVYANIQSENVIVENIYLEASNNFGIAFGNVKGGSISKVYTKNCYREVIGLEADGGTSSVVEGVHVSDCYILATEDSSYNFGGTVGPAIFVGAGATDGKVRNCSLSDILIECTGNVLNSGYNGISVIGGATNATEYVTLSNIEVKTPTKRGIDVGSLGVTTRNIYINNVNIIGAGSFTTGGSPCIYVRNATNVYVDGATGKGTTHTYFVEESTGADNNIFLSIKGDTPTTASFLLNGASTKVSMGDVHQFRAGAMMMQSSGTVANDGTFTFSTFGASGRGIYRIVGNYGTGDYAIFHVSSGTITSIALGANTVMAAVNPDTPGKLNVYLTGNVVTIKNRLGSSRVFVLESVGTSFT